MIRHLEEQEIEHSFYQLVDRLNNSIHAGEYLTINLDSIDDSVAMDSL